MSTISNSIIFKAPIRDLKKMIAFFLILISIFSPFTSPVYAATSPWTQTDWVGGSGQTSWSDSTKFDSSSNVTTSTAGQATLTATSGWCSNASCDSSWAYRKKITFDNTDASLGVTSENLTNFPVLVKLSSSNIDYTKTQDSGQDIRFTDTDGSDLAYEIEKWDETGTSWVWVKAPQIDINSSTDYIYLYYGNTSATDHQQATSVWDSNTKAVWHMHNSSSPATDSTSGGSSANQTGGVTFGATGQINSATTYNGSNYLNAGDINSVDGVAGLTVSLWLNPSNLTGSKSLVTKWNYGVNNSGWYFQTDGSQVRVYIANLVTDAGSNNGITTNANLTTSTWYYITYFFYCMLADYPTSLKMYVNGTAKILVFVIRF